MTTDQKQLIEFTRFHITRLGKQQEDAYNELIKTLKIEDNDYLWDYCFNCENDESAYTNNCTQQIFKE